MKRHKNSMKSFSRNPRNAHVICAWLQSIENKDLRNPRNSRNPRGRACDPLRELRLLREARKNKEI